MLRYLKTLFYIFIFTFIFTLGVYINSNLLTKLFVKLKLQDYFDIEHIANGIVILSAILTLLGFRLCHWYFKRLKAQKDD